MKKIGLFIIICFCFIFFSINIYADELEVTSTNYGVYNAENLELLIGKNENQKISIASITKLMTAVVFVDNVENLNEKIVVDYSKISSILDPELAVAGIYNGQELSYYNLLATMLVPSGADSAIYIACTTFGDYGIFISKMNEKAQELGMTSSHFSNPTGLDDEENYSSIDDVAKLLKYVIENPILKEVISMSSYTTEDGKLTVQGTIAKNSRLRGININYIKGGKTGTTEDAGICLASYSLDDDGTTLITVVTGASMYSSRPYNIIDTETLDGYIIQNYSIKDILTTSDEILSLKTYCTKQDNVKFYLESPIKYYIKDLDKEKIKIEYNGIEELSVKNTIGQKLGEVKIYYDNKLLTTEDIYLKEELHFDILKWVKLHKTEVIFSVTMLVCIIIIICFSISNRKKKKNKK